MLATVATPTDMLRAAPSAVAFLRYLHRLLVRAAGPTPRMI